MSRPTSHVFLLLLLGNARVSSQNIRPPTWVWNSNPGGGESPPPKAAASFSDIFGLQLVSKGVNSRAQLELAPNGRFIWPSDSSPTPVGATTGQRPSGRSLPTTIFSSPLEDIALFGASHEGVDNQLHQLDVHHPNSPYGLIQDVLPSRKQQPRSVSGQPADVWLSDGNLLVLKGGTTSSKDGFDSPWQPLDDYEAPYREPVLAPDNILQTQLGRFAGIAVVVPPPTVRPNQGNRRPRLGFNQQNLQGRSNFKASAFVLPSSPVITSASPGSVSYPPIKPSAPIVFSGGSQNNGWVPSDMATPVISTFLRSSARNAGQSNFGGRFHRHISDRNNSNMVLATTKAPTKRQPAIRPIQNISNPQQPIVQRTPSRHIFHVKQPHVQTLQQQHQRETRVKLEREQLLKQHQPFPPVKVVQYPWAGNKHSQKVLVGTFVNADHNGKHVAVQKRPPLRISSLVSNDNIDFLSSPGPDNSGPVLHKHRLTTAVNYLSSDDFRTIPLGASPSQTHSFSRGQNEKRRQPSSFSNSLLPLHRKRVDAEKRRRGERRKPQLKVFNGGTIRNPKRRKR